MDTKRTKRLGRSTARRGDRGGLRETNTELREALAFLLDNPDDEEAQAAAEKVLAETRKAAEEGAA